MSFGICKECGGSFYETFPGARGEDLCDDCEYLRDRPKRNFIREDSMFFPQDPDTLASKHCRAFVDKRKKR